MSTSSDDESVPPDPQPKQAPANSSHPVWEAAAGRGAASRTGGSDSGRGGGAGRGAGGRGRGGGTVTATGRYAPISMALLEKRSRQECDDCATSVASEDRRDRNGAKRKASHQHPMAQPHGAYGCGADDAADDESADADGGAESDEERAIVAGAAFGGGANKRRNGCTALSVASEADSITSSHIRAAHKRAFPISGVSCVGCALPAKIAVVEQFVQENMSKMADTPLFKMAALVYQSKVAEPAEAEGVPVPAWGWRDVRAHFTLHRVDPRFQRCENIRTLSAMRKTLELALLREDEQTGEHSLDRANAESIMKIIALQSKEISLLSEPTKR